MCTAPEIVSGMPVRSLHRGLPPLTTRGLTSTVRKRAIRAWAKPTRSMRTWATVVCSAAVLALGGATPLVADTITAARIDRRVVDTVDAGDATSEASHGYVGSDVTAGMSGGKSFRQARGWMHYALTTFDDTPVTVACTFLGSDNTGHSYDVFVEDSLIATKSFVAQAGLPVVVEIAVPFAVTKGRSHIAVIIRPGQTVIGGTANSGSTPMLRQIRTIQDHNEVQ